MRAMNPNQAKLLIADDCESMREVTRDLMQGLGFARVDAAADGQVALALFRSNHYDLVISDWNMPFLTGIELLQRIRLGPFRNETPVLITSGHVTPERTNEAFNAGATGFFGKPFATARLCEKVLRLVGSLNPVSDCVHAPHEERILQLVRSS